MMTVRPDGTLTYSSWMHRIDKHPATDIHSCMAPAIRKCRGSVCRPSLPRLDQHPEESTGLDEHDVTGRTEDLHREVEGLLGAVGDEEAFGGGGGVIVADEIARWEGPIKAGGMQVD